MKTVLFLFISVLLLCMVNTYSSSAQNQGLELNYDSPYDETEVSGFISEKQQDGFLHDGVFVFSFSDDTFENGKLRKNFSINIKESN